MVSFGLDPSYKAYGAALIDTTNKSIYLNEFTSSIDASKPTTILDTIPILTKSVVNWYMTKIPRRDKKVVTSIELDTAYANMYQAELYALDYAMYNFSKTISDFTYLYNTYYIRYLKNGVTIKCDDKLDPKEKTIYLAQELLDIFTKMGYNIVEVGKLEDTRISTTKKKGKYPRTSTISSGEADAFMLALRGVIRHTSDIKLYKAILTKCPRLANDKELG